MRFYIAIEENSLKLRVMSFFYDKIDGDEIIIPMEGSPQPIAFPIPKKMKAKCTKFVNIVLKDRGVQDIFALPVTKRSEKMKLIRKEYNPKIIEKLYEFRDLHAEDFL